MQLVHNLETGQASGTAATALNSVASGQTAFDSVSNAPTYDNTHVHDGSLALKAAPAAQAQRAITWGSTAMGAVTPSQVWGRFYVYVTGAPAAYGRFVAMSSGGTQKIGVGIGTNGKLTIRRISNATDIVTTVNNLPTNQWVRVEYMVLFSATIGQATIAYYSGVNLDGTTADESITSAASQNTDTTTIDQVQYGMVFSTSQTYSVWLDDIGFNNTGFMGASLRQIAAGATPSTTIAAPSGSVQADAVLSSTPPGVAVAAPAGSVSTDQKVSATPGGVAIAAPTGAVVTGQTVAAAVPGVAVAAPAGSVSTGQVLAPSGAPGLAVAAPAGSVSASVVLAPTAVPDLAIGAPPGTVIVTAAAVSVTVVPASTPGVLVGAVAGAVDIAARPAATPGEGFTRRGFGQTVLDPQDFADVLHSEAFHRRLNTEPFAREINPGRDYS